MLTLEERCALHIAAGMEFGDLSDPQVTECGLITSTSDRFVPVRLGAITGDTRLARIGLHFALIHAIAFVGIDPIDAVDNVVASGVRRDTAERVKHVIVGSKAHLKIFLHCLAVVEPMYGVRSPHFESRLLGDT